MWMRTVGVVDEQTCDGERTGSDSTGQDKSTHQAGQLHSIQSGHGEGGAQHEQAIVTNRVVLVVWLNSLAELSTGVIIHSYGPTSFHEVLQFEVEETGAVYGHHQ